MNHLAKTVNGKNYGVGPSGVHITKNTIEYNNKDGILAENAGDNLNIKSNSISDNKCDGISLSHVGSNKIQSNVISGNDVGIRFRIIMLNRIIKI